MADTIATLALKTTLDASGLVQGLQQSEQSTANWSKNIQAHGADLEKNFSAGRDRFNKMIADFKSGNVSGIAGDVKGLFDDAKSLTSMNKAQEQIKALTDQAGKAGVNIGEALGGTGVLSLGRFAAAAGPVVAVAGAMTAGIVAFGSAVNATSVGLDNLGRFAERTGTTAVGAQGTLRFLQRAGLDPEEAEHALTHFRRVLGEMRRDPAGAAGQMAERIGLDPRRLTEMDTSDALRATIGALGRVGNSFDRAASAQDFFARGSERLGRAMQMGEAGFDRAASFANRFGATDEMVGMGRETEDIYRRLRQANEEASGQMSQDWEYFKGRVGLGFARLQEDLHSFAEKLRPYDRLRNFFTTGSFSIPEPPPPPAGANANLTPAGSERQEVANLLANGPAVNRVADIDTQVNNFLRAGRERIRFMTQWRDEAVQIGAVSADASKEEFDAVRPLIEQRAQLIAKGADQAAIERINADIVMTAQTGQREWAQTTLQNLGRQIGMTTRLRDEAERLGYVQGGATRQEIEAVRPLLEMRERLERVGGGFSVALFDVGARALQQGNLANTLRDQSQQWYQQAQTIGLNAQELRQYRIGQLEAQVAGGGWLSYLSRGELASARASDRTLTLAENLDRLRQAGRQLEDANRTPLESFQRQLDAINENHTASETFRNRARASAFNQAIASLGPGPSSFGISATDSRSREGALQADDFRIRSQLQGGNPMEQVARGIDALVRGDAIRAQREQRVADAIAAIERQGIVLQRRAF